MHYTKRILIAALVAAPLSTAAAQLVSETWVDPFNGPANQDDYMLDMQVDSVGNVYVVGGTREFVNTSYFSRFLTLKYDADGNRLWFRTHKGGPVNLDSSLAHSVAIDGNDDVIVAGSVKNGKNWGLVKYDAAGNVLWSRNYVLGSTSLVNPEEVVVDGAGNIYMTGYYANTGTTAKYDAAGSFQWDVQFNGTGGGATSSAIAVDAAGNSYIAGTTIVSGLSGEFGVHKIDPAGDIVWFKTFGAPGFASDRAYDVAVDGAGDIVAVGVFAANTALGSDVAAVKLDSTGAVIWQRFWDSPAGSSDVGAKLALDSQGAVVIAGYTRTLNFDYDAIALKYSANGVFQWSNVYAGTALFDDYGWDVGVDAADNVVLVGQMTPLTGSDHYFTVCYDSAGAQQWEMTYGGPLNGSSYGYGLAIDGTTVYVSGESDNFNFDTDVTTIKYESAPAIAFCSSQVNSEGCVPSMGYTGNPSASAGSGFDVTVAGLLSNRNGILFYSVVGSTSTPFGGGTMCALAPTRRTPLQNTGGNLPPTDCSGSIAYDFNAWIALGKDPALVSGQQVWSQFWSRDPQAVGTNTNLSDALTFILGN